jgi:N-acetylmuramoyl-L-alanine amidase
MTSVLVECGFLTNEKEAIFLNSDYGQDILASAIFRAIRTQLQTNHPTITFVKSTTESTDDKKGEGSYHIQLMSSKEPMDTDGEAFKKTGLKVTRTKLDTSNAYKYRYTAGPYNDKESAEKDLEKAKKNGFKDAYIIKI